MSDNKSLPTALGKGQTALERARAAVQGVKKSADQRKAFEAAVEAGRKVKIAMLIDATASRQDSWDAATVAQNDLTQGLGTLASTVETGIYAHSGSVAYSLGWHKDSANARGAMQRLECRTGTTRIEDCLNLIDQETKNARPDITVAIGDCFEETPERVINAAKRIGTPVFCFYEKTRSTTDEDIAAFKRLSDETGGACVPLGSDPTELVNYIRTAVAFKKGGSALDSLKGTPAYEKMLAANPNLLRLAAPAPKLPGQNGPN